MSDTRLILGICPKCGKVQIPAELHRFFLPVLRVVAACGGVASGADCDRIDFSGAGGLQLRGCTSAGLRYRVSGRLSPFDQNGV